MERGLAHEKHLRAASLLPRRYDIFGGVRVLVLALVLRAAACRACHLSARRSKYPVRIGVVVVRPHDKVSSILQIRMVFFSSPFPLFLCLRRTFLWLHQKVGRITSVFGLERGKGQEGEAERKRRKKPRVHCSTNRQFQVIPAAAAGGRAACSTRRTLQNIPLLAVGDDTNCPLCPNKCADENRSAHAISHLAR